MKHVALALLVLGCSGNRPQSCTPESRAALTALYEKAAVEVVTSGACDSSGPVVTDCAAYQIVAAHMRVAQKAICP